MQPLKIIVIVMGVMIVLGLGIVVFAAIQRLGGQGRHGFEATSLTLPKGCHIVGMASAGSRLALRLGDGPDCQLILFVDPESGRETGRIGLLAQP